MIGTGESSEIVEIGLCDKPATVTSIEKVISLSSDTELTVKWEAPAETDLPAGRIINYKLYIDNGYYGDYTLV